MSKVREQHARRTVTGCLAARGLRLRMLGIAASAAALVLLGLAAGQRGAAAAASDANDAGKSAFTADGRTWTPCAAENDICRFSGTRDVLYGTAKQHVIKTFSNSADCNNGVFGDPAPGMDKSCAVAPTAGNPAGSIASTAAAPAASQGAASNAALPNAPRAELKAPPGQGLRCSAPLMLIGALALTALLYGLQGPLARWWPKSGQDYPFVVSFVCASLIFYPLVTLPTARLERRLNYSHIAWIESVGMLLERGAPALILLWFHSGVYSFLWALLLSRVFRVIALSRFHRCAIWLASVRQVRQSCHLLGEGSWIQLGSLSNVVRDNLHVLLIGPFFGKEWIGNYTWALQVCQISSQAFAQISARVALPVFAQSGSFDERWTKCLLQIRLLTVLTGPVLCGVWFMLPAVNASLFRGKWELALVLIPLLFFRMLPGLATTPLGPLLMVHRGGYIYAKVLSMWTLAELLGAVACIWLLGPIGLAWSYAVMVWIGLWLMLGALGQTKSGLAKQLIAQIFSRPGLYFATLSVLSLAFIFRNEGLLYSNSLLSLAVLACTVVVGSYLLEPDIRQLIKHEEV